MARENIPLRSDFDKKFKPIFEEYEESGGIPLVTLQERLDDEGLAQDLSPGTRYALLRKADRNRDGHLNYEEFIQMATDDTEGFLSSTELTRWQRAVRNVVGTVVPSNREDVVKNYVEYYTCRPPPLFMILISIAEVVIFIYYAVELKDTKYPVTATSGCPTYSPFIFKPTRRYEAWRYFSYMFVHVGYLHLIFNLIFQLALGLPLEMVHKWWRMGIVYTLGAAAGSLCHTVFDARSMLAGASGGCYALIGAHFAIIIMNWKEMTHGWMSGPIKFISSAPVRLVFWSLLAGVDTGLAIWKRYTGEAGSNVGYAAHFGGALAGLLIGIPVLRNIDEKPWEKIVWWISLILYVICVIFAVLWNTFYPHFPPTDWSPCCP